jgi:hypothetical protein
MEKSSEFGLRALFLPAKRGFNEWHARTESYSLGQIWHITHRCHKKELLLKFASGKFRKQYTQYLP